jgi:oxygen-independent coproporphyrinogen-3 oxidase
VARDGSGERRRTALTRAEQVEELLVMGLRLAEGVDLARLAHMAGRPLREVLDPVVLERFMGDRWLVRRDDRLAATTAGRQRLNALLGALLADGSTSSKVEESLRALD